MFVVIVHFPPIKQGKEEEFREWFSSSNKGLAAFRGFVGRRLLKPAETGNYVALIEYESRETFVATVSSPFHDESAAKVAPLLDGSPIPQMYEVLLG
jgi:heme-degrading monooxygenase HmoA